MLRFAGADRVCLLMLSSIVLSAVGCRAKPPGKFESGVAQWTKHHVTVDGKQTHNPIEASADSIRQGQQTFGSYCSVCHGMDGQNTGVPFATEMSPPVPSLASAEVQSYTDGQLKWIIENGLYPSGMPPSKGDFSDEDMWQMVLFIRHLPKQGSLGSPKVYSGS
jgi:mono/diheme cytochrome c family protein